MTKTKLKRLAKIVAANALFNSLGSEYDTELLTEEEFEILHRELNYMAYKILGNIHVPTEALFVRNLDLLIEYV